MQMFEIEDIKDFMSLLFLKDKFDKFYVTGMEVKTFVPITIRGNLLKEWCSGEEQEAYGGDEYVRWSLLQPLAFSLIKGKQTPGMLRIQFVQYMDNGDCGGLRVQFENGKLICISSYTTETFTLERSGEQLWDEQCIEFFAKNGIVSTRQ